MSKLQSIEKPVIDTKISLTVKYIDKKIGKLQRDKEKGNSILIIELEKIKELLTT